MRQQVPFTFVPKSGVTPALDEYKAFHGMVCGSASSQRCIDSFDGCALFAHVSDYEDGRDLISFDYNRTFPILTLFSYYCLVVLSSTGLLTLLGKTNLVLCREETQQIVAIADDPQAAVAEAESFGKEKLCVPSKVVDYMLDRSKALSKSNNNSSDNQEAPKLMLQKRFEFQFANYASVVMFHFVCNNGFKYLVEVYETHSWYGIYVPKLFNYVTGKLSPPQKSKRS